MPRGLYFRLAAVFILLLAASMVLTTERAAQITSAHLMAQITRELSEKTRLVAELMSDTDPADPDALADAVNHIGKLTHTRITIVNPAGTVLADSDTDYRYMENHGDRPEIEDALAGRTGQVTRRSESLDADMIYVASPWHPGVLAPASAPYVIRVAVPRRQVTQHIQTVRRAISVLAVFATLVAALLTFFIARQLSRPLTQMTDLAERIAQGDFHGRIPIVTNDEIGQLARAFNQMASKLEAQVIQLSQRREELERILSTMSDGVVAVDNQANLLLINLAATMLFGVNAVAERRPLVETVRQPQLINAVRQVLDRNESHTFELQLHHPVERIIDASVSPIAPAENSDGLVGAIAVLRDVTELRRLERVRQDFVANVSHELRTPLTAIKGFVETLKETDDPKERASYLAIVEEESDRLAFMVEDLLQLARLESPSTELCLEPENPADLVLHALHLLQPKIAAKNLQVQVQEAQAPPVLAEANLIDQALINLLDNAIKYTPAGGKITISYLDLRDGFVRFIVEDTGPGIEPKHAERIFERFYRIDKARSRQLGGTGLGLAIVKHTVERHKGRVGVYSKLGEGSSFWFDLPVYPESRSNADTGHELRKG